MISVKGIELYPVARDKRDREVFRVIHGWLSRFLRHNNFSLRKSTTAAQKDAPIEKLANFVVFSNCQIKSKKIQPKNAIAMDETDHWTRENACHGGLSSQNRWDKD